MTYSAEPITISDNDYSQYNPYGYHMPPPEQWYRTPWYESLRVLPYLMSFCFGERRSVRVPLYLLNCSPFCFNTPMIIFEHRQDIVGPARWKVFCSAEGVVLEGRSLDRAPSIPQYINQFT